jgi:hypothetical protein
MHAVHLPVIPHPRRRAAARRGGGVSAPLEVTRLLQNPLGQPAPAGARGDIVRVSDGTVAVYLTPAEFDAATEADLRYELARQAVAGRAGRTGTDARRPSRPA